MQLTSLSSTQLHKVAEVLQEMEDEKGVVSRVVGLFSFINLVWFLSILGIVATLGPVLVIFAQPLVAVTHMSNTMYS